MSKTVYDQYENGMMYTQIQISGKLTKAILSTVKRANLLNWFVDEHVNVQSVQLQTSAFGATHLSPSRTWAYRPARGAKCEMRNAKFWCNISSAYAEAAELPRSSTDYTGVACNICRNNRKLKRYALAGRF